MELNETNIVNTHRISFSVPLASVEFVSDPDVHQKQFEAQCRPRSRNGIDMEKISDTPSSGESSKSDTNVVSYLDGDNNKVTETTTSAKHDKQTQTSGEAASQTDENLNETANED